ncbi:GGDEF domain-containing protein [Clostridia bacterium]|nr:GGDEF domain-containing protein [Clostridia bacterium]
MGRERFNSRNVTLFFLFFIAVMLICGILTYNMSARALRVQMGQKCSALAYTLALLLEEDADGYIEFTKTLDTDTDYYRKVKSEFVSISRANAGNIKYLYTELYVNDEKMMYVLGGEEPSSPLYTAPGALDDMTDLRREAYETRAAVTGDRFVGTAWGSLLTAYSPIYNHATGEFAGLVGVEVEVSQYNAVLRPQFISIAVGLCVVFLLTGAVLTTTSARVSHKFNVDDLTGLYSNNYFMAALNYQMKECARNKQELYVIVSDLDHFKKINDVYGRQFGDEILKRTADILGANLRKTDCLARYEGERFISFIASIPKDKLLGTMRRMRTQINEQVSRFDDSDIDVRVTVSIGAAKIERGTRASEAIETAEKALRKAKETRDTCVLDVEGKLIVDRDE